MISTILCGISLWIRSLDEAIQFIEKGDDFENIDSIQLARTYANDGPLGYTGDQVGGYFVRWSKDLSDEDYYTEETDDKATYCMATMPTEPIVAATFNKELVEREGELLEKTVCGQMRALFGARSELTELFTADVTMSTIQRILCLLLIWEMLLQAD